MLLRMHSMKCVAARLILAAGLLSACSPALAATDVWRDLAEQALQQALTARYPAVRHWQITALSSARQEQRFAAQFITDASVLHVGKRSVVQLWCELPQRRQCATVWFAVRGMQWMLSSSNELPAASSLTSAVLALEEHDVLQLKCESLQSVEGLADWRTTRHLRAGEALCRNFLEPRPSVSRGESVRVRASAGSLAVSARGIAEQDGNAGQMIRVRRSNETFTARVTGSGQVAVDE